MNAGIEFIKRRIVHLDGRIDSQQNLIDERKAEIDKEMLDLTELKEERDGLQFVLDSVKD